MKTLLLLITIISYAYAYVDENVLTNLQSLEHWNTFRIVLPHTADECFYLETKSNDTVHVIYQVLRGGNSHIRVIITDPLGSIIFSRAGSPFGWYNAEHVQVSGTYKICFKNEQYFTTKIIYIGVLAVHSDLLHEANIDTAKEKKDNDTAAVEEFSMNIMRSLSDMSSTLYQVTAYQTVGRVQHLHDLYSVESNASYVRNWAICQIITMIVCSMIQVFTIRRLFKITSSYKQYNQPTSGHFISTN